MEFQVDDVVVHPSYGLGKIVGVKSMEYMGAEARLYYEVSLENGTVWVPADPDDSKIRPITPIADLSHYRAVIQSRPLPLDEDRHKHNSEFKSRLKNASFEVLCEMMRDLTAHGWEKKLNEYESLTLRKITDILAKEWAASAGISPSEAEAEMRALLNRSREIYAG